MVRHERKNKQKQHTIEQEFYLRISLKWLQLR